MSKIKICGIYRQEDIEYINTYKPDYCGFIINFEKSHRNVNIESLKNLSKQIDKDIKKVGVFVNEDKELIIQLLNDDILDLCQLHGNEDETYIQYLKDHTSKEIIKFFKVKTIDDIKQASISSADHILLDSGKGSGKTFDWSLLNEMQRPYFLAGGIDINNIEEALQYEPFALDVSSGAETNKVKDKIKIKQLINIVRRER